jgi:hypothetical protein
MHSNCGLGMKLAAVKPLSVACLLGRLHALIATKQNSPSGMSSRVHRIDRHLRNAAALFARWEKTFIRGFPVMK